MISRAEIAQAMRGVWLLFMGRPDAVQLFDTSIDGFWASFQAILLVAPIYAFTVAADFLAYAGSPDPAAPAIDPAAIFFSRGLTVAIDWITLPILLALLASSLGIRSGYMAYVVVRNWGTVFTLVPYAAVSILELSGMFPRSQLIADPEPASPSRSRSGSRLRQRGGRWVRLSTSRSDSWCSTSW